MCGIAALIAGPDESFSAAELASLTACLHHRGPDHAAEATWRRVGADAADLRIGVGHTRLSILDLTSSGDQPMRGGNDTVTLVFNGEVYNYIELRTQLRRLGHSFTSTGDTEVVLKSYLQWGPECVGKFVGMFAFIIIDERRGTVFASRDPYGIKPLYLARCDRGWVLASEMKALLRIRGVSRQVDPSVALRYLRFGQASDGVQTIYRNIRHLAAGHSMSIDLETLEHRVVRHYKLPTERLHASDVGFDEAAVQLQELFASSVDMHRRSDVVVGTALSGGIDSSSVVAMLRHVAGDSAQLNAFTYAATGSSADEEGWARIAARSATAEHHIVSPTGEDFAADLDTLTRIWDEPLAGTSLYAQYAVFRKVAETGIKVLLDGQGADEILGGYPRYFSARLASLLRLGDFRTASRLLARGRHRGIPMLGALAGCADFLLPARGQDLVRPLAGRSLSPSWLQAEWFVARGAGLRPAHATKAREVLRDQLINDLTHESLPNLLRHEDTNSMLWSVESRVPFLIPSVVEFCLSLPEDYLVSNSGETKAVLRAAMRGHVPDVILDRTDKIGFAPPPTVWLGQAGPEFARLTRDALDRLPFLVPAEVHRIAQRAVEDARAAETMWRIIFMSKWAEQHEVIF